MNTIKLSIQKNLLGRGSRVGAVASLRQIDAAGNSLRGNRIEVAVPANRDGNRIDIPVDPGRWLIEATMPSGEIIAEEVVVPDVGDTKSYSTFGTTLADRIESFNRPDLAAVPTRLQDWLSALEKPSVHLLHLPQSGGAWHGVLQPAAEAVGGEVDRDKFDAEEGFYLYRFSSNAAAPTTVHAFVQAVWRKETFAISLPAPWRGIEFMDPAPVELMLRMHPLERTVRIGVAVEDPDFGTMAGLMTASTLAKAASVVDQARDLLFEKTNNPLAAAAGAYILLAAGRTEDQGRSEWHRWIDNLNAQYPHIPDGAVLKATLRLRNPTSEQCYDEAKAALVEAFERGLPYFSIGVSWLLDGLTLFAADDPEIQRRLKLVQQVAVRIDPSQAFTIVRVSEKARTAK